MKRLWVLTLWLLCASLAAGSAREGLREQLDRFLAGATVNDAAIHDAFWAKELVYTSSSGMRFGKASLMAGVRETGPVPAEDVDAVYGAENVRVRMFGDLALLDFTLVAREAGGAVQRYLDSGVFVWRGDRWQAVNWHATRQAPMD